MGVWVWFLFPPFWVAVVMFVVPILGYIWEWRKDKRMEE